MSGSLDDNSLVKACRAGETEAFGLLVRRYQDRLFPTLVRLLGSHEDAQDILQDAFIRAYEKLDQFQGDSSFYTWVYRIAVNLALSGHRKRRSRGLLWKMLPVRNRSEIDSADESPEADPAFNLEREERETRIQSALDALGPEQRAVVVLKDFDGRRYEEISVILDIPIGTVRSRLHRARCELREQLRTLIDAEFPAAPSVPGGEKISP